MLVEKLKKSYEAGVEKVKWFASIFSERLKVEAAVIKLLKESGKVEKQRDLLVKSIGERVFELRGRADVDVFTDTGIRQALDELEKLDAEMRELKSRASEIGRVD